MQQPSKEKAKDVRTYQINPRDIRNRQPVQSTVITNISDIAGSKKYSIYVNKVNTNSPPQGNLQTKHTGVKEGFKPPSRADQLRNDI